MASTEARVITGIVDSCHPLKSGGSLTNRCKVVENKRLSFLLFQHRETADWYSLDWHCPFSVFVPPVCLFESIVGTLQLFVSCPDHTSQHSSTRENSLFLKVHSVPTADSTGRVDGTNAENLDNGWCPSQIQIYS